MKPALLEELIFDQSISFFERAFAVFTYQYQNVKLYQDFCDYLKIEPNNINKLKDFPFLPIEFFKTHQIKPSNKKTEQVFRSSGTTGQVQSQHFIADLNLYEQSIRNGFSTNYGNPKDYCIIGLLPSYLERSDASLVYMVDFLMKKSNHPENGFYLNNYQELANKLAELLENKQQVILFGVTFALLDFAEQFPMDLQDTIIIETGGMKGRRKEITREELHQTLQAAFQVDLIHSEYGMTELLSQAYYQANGYFTPASTMQVLLREIQDPFHYLDDKKTGALNIIDLSNLYSCSFIATQDVGKRNGHQFQVLGRTDFSDLRGCNLMVE